MALKGRSWNIPWAVMLLTFTLYLYDTRPGCLIRSFWNVCKYRKCGLFTGVITLLNDLLQANHQGWIGMSKTKSIGPLFCTHQIFFHPCQEPVCRLYFEELHNFQKLFFVSLQTDFKQEIRTCCWNIYSYNWKFTPVKQDLDWISSVKIIIVLLNP